MPESAAETLAGVNSELNQRIADLKPEHGEPVLSGKRLGLILLILAGAFVAYTFFIRRKSATTATAAADPTAADPSSTPTDPPPASTPPPTVTPPPTPPPGHTPPPVPPPVHTPPPPPPASVTYTVKSGDTLSSIAAIYHTTWQALYDRNKSTIDSWAKARGEAAPYYNWIFPGEILHIN